jgi:hypothetical protein
MVRYNNELDEYESYYHHDDHSYVLWHYISLCANTSPDPTTQPQGPTEMATLRAPSGKNMLSPLSATPLPALSVPHSPTS